MIIAALIWAGVILASYFALTLNMKFATIPFEKLEEVLVSMRLRLRQSLVLENLLWNL